MGIASIIENINFTFNCFGNNSENYAKKKIVDRGKEFNVIVLPIEKNIQLEDIFPKTNHVEEWNIFIIGKGKNYILANIKSLGIDVIHTDKILNTKGLHTLPEELINFLDSVWDETLKGTSMQFFIIVKSITYLCNSFPLQTSAKNNIGALLFIRKMYAVNSDEFG
jgi:hypothetical protein